MHTSSVHNLTPEDIAYLRSLPSSDFEAWLSSIAASNEDVAAQILFAVRARQVADKRALTEFFGVAPETVDLWVRKGMPTEPKAGGEARYDPQACAQWLARQKNSLATDDEDKKSANDYREEKRKIAELQRRKMEGELFEIRHLEERLTMVKGTIRKGLDQVQKAFGDNVVAELSRIVDDALDAIGQRDNG